MIKMCISQKKLNQKLTKKKIFMNYIASFKMYKPLAYDCGISQAGIYRGFETEKGKKKAEIEDFLWITWSSIVSGEVWC